MNFRFDLVDLQLFLNTVEAGSITAGAVASQLSLAAASERLQSLEDTLGAPLLVRRTRGVQPSAAGQTLVLHARILLQKVEQMQSDLAEHAKSMKAQIRLLCDTVALNEVLPERLATFLQENPHVNLLVDDVHSDVAVKAVQQGMADVGIVRATAELFELEHFLFGASRLVIVAPPGHLLAKDFRGRPILLEQADPCDIVGLFKGTALQDLWDDRVAQRGRELNYRIRVGSFGEQCRLVARGAGIALMPYASASRHARALALEVVPIADQFAAFDLRVCVRKLAELPAASRRLVTSLLSGQSQSFDSPEFSGEYASNLRSA